MKKQISSKQIIQFYSLFFSLLIIHGTINSQNDTSDVPPPAEDLNEIPVPEEINAPPPIEENILSPEEESIESPEKIADTVGPETQDLPEEKIGSQGNWVKKNDWLKQTQEQNDSIQDTAVDIQKFSKTFYDKFKSIDDELDDFYRNVGFDRGKLDKLFENIEKDLKNNKEQNLKLLSKSLNIPTDEKTSTTKFQYKAIYKIEETFKQQNVALTQLKLDMKSILDLDASIRDRLKKLDEQITTAISEAGKAKTLSEKDIWYVIDDKKAKAIFYEIKGIKEKIDVIQNYVKQDLSNDFEKVLKTVKEQISKTKEKIQKIEEIGIIIVNRTTRIEEIRKKQLEEIKNKKIQQPQDEKKPTKKTLKKSNWYDKFIEFFNNIKLFFVSLYEVSFGTTIPHKKTKTESTVENKKEEKENNTNIPVSPIEKEISKNTGKQL